MQSLGAIAMLFFCKVDTSFCWLVCFSTSSQKLPKLSSFLDGLFFSSLLPFKERIPGLHVGPRDTAIGQIANYAGQFRDLG